MKKRNLPSIILILLWVGLSNNAYAEEVTAPKYENGEWWKFSYKGESSWSRSDRPDDLVYTIEIKDQKPVSEADGHRYTQVVPGIVPEAKWFEFPLSVGKKWSQRRMIGDKWRNEDFEVLGTETVTVPAGTFETIKIMRSRGSQMRGSEAVIYYAPKLKVGVKMTSKGTGGSSSEVVLVEYGKK